MLSVSEFHVWKFWTLIVEEATTDSLLLSTFNLLLTYGFSVHLDKRDDYRYWVASWIQVPARRFWEINLAGWKGNFVRIEDGPAAVTGDKSCRMPLSKERWEGAGRERTGSQKTCLNTVGMTSWTEAYTCDFGYVGKSRIDYYNWSGIFCFPRTRLCKGKHHV